LIIHFDFEIFVVLLERGGDIRVTVPSGARHLSAAVLSMSRAKARPGEFFEHARYLVISSAALTSQAPRFIYARPVPRNAALDSLPACNDPNDRRYSEIAESAEPPPSAPAVTRTRGPDLRGIYRVCRSLRRPVVRCAADFLFRTTAEIMRITPGPERAISCGFPRDTPP